MIESGENQLSEVVENVTQCKGIQQNLQKIQVTVTLNPEILKMAYAIMKDCEGRRRLRDVSLI